MMSTLLDQTYLQSLVVALLVTLAVLIFLNGVMKERSHRQTQRQISQFVNAGPRADGPEDVLTKSFGERIIKPTFQAMLTKLGAMTPAKNRDRLRMELLMAGNPGNMTTTAFSGLKWIAGLVIGLLAAVYGNMVFHLPTIQVVLCGLGGVFLGTYYPPYWLRGRIKKRNEAIKKALPDALDMLTIVVDAGMGFDQALIKLRERWKNELTLEFERVVNEMRMGVRKMDALHNMAERSDVPELRSFIAVMIQTDRLGISISNVLHVQSQQMRIRRRQEAEEEAHKAPIKMLIPIMFFILPALFAIILGPAVPAIMAAF